MSTPLSSARTLVKRAKKDLAKLDRRTTQAIKRQKYEIFSEPDPNKPELVQYKMRLKRELPDAVSDLTGHVVNNLRSALDHALYGIARISGCKKTVPRAYFPFSKDSTTFENNLAGSCADVPKGLWPLLRHYKPYLGGEDFLFALNQMCGSNKHALIIPVVTATMSAAVDMAAIGFCSAPYPYPVWDKAKNEMWLFTVHRSATNQFKCNLGFHINIAFGEVGLLHNCPVFSNLEKFIWMVEIILDEIESESRRLGFIK